MSRADRAFLRALDLALALLLLPLAAGAFLLLLVPQALCFGAVFHRSRRVGRGGAVFTYLKIRTMRPAEGAGGGGRAHLEAGRIPPWGRFLRRTHLDEIPEVAGILLGRGSFVGPRPLLPEHAALVDSPERRSLRPGWTGLSQLFLQRRGLLPGRIQRRLDRRLGRELGPRLYLRVLLASVAALGRGGGGEGMSPGPTVLAYREKAGTAPRRAGPPLLLAIIGLLSLAAPARPDAESDLEILGRAYPDAFEVLPGRGIRFPGGAEVPYDDGEEKDFAALLERPDLEDMLRLPYPLGEGISPPAENFDPGRFRPDAFFRGLYGADEAEIRAGLRPVRWMPSLGGPWLLVQRRFGIDRKVEAVVAELEALGPEYARYLSPPGGSYNYRAIAGTRRLSAHSYGIAVDIAVAPSHYWQWEALGAGEYRNAIPRRIVAVFESHGFIWGGRWYHYDTMHFEYRPELVLKARGRR